MLGVVDTALTCEGAWLPVITPQRRQSRYDAILAAAKEAFAERGFESVSIAHIARLAGISDGLIYHYFRDKRDLLFHVLRVFYERIMVELDEKVARVSGFQARLEALIRAHIEVFVADRDLCRLFLSEVRVASDYAGSPVQDLNRRYTSALVAIVEDGVRTGEVSARISPRLLRDAVFGAIEHRAWRHVNGGGRLDPEETARDLALLFTQGLCGRAVH